jgi:drug/metabolite transporter (DMT)-like permease
MIPALFIFRLDLKLYLLVQSINLFNILFLVLGASALCFVTWNSAVKLLGAVKTSAYIHMVPVITAITSILVLQEKVTSVAVLGIALTLAGVFISENGISKKATGEFENE